MKTIYSKLIHIENQQLAQLGLDTYFFQCKLIENDYDDLKRRSTYVNNRLYGDMFKLLKIIIYQNNEYEKTAKHNTAVVDLSKITRYEELNPYKLYTYSEHRVVFIALKNVINEMTQIHNQHVSTDKISQLLQDSGLEISNFIEGRQFTHDVWNQQIHLFSRSLQYLCDFHQKTCGLHKKRINDIFNEFDKSVQFQNTSGLNLDTIIENLQNNETEA
jgi:hypothetical protein